MQSLAVVVIHSYLDPTLEAELGTIARAVGFEHVSLSHRVSPELGLLARTETTVLDAYLTPLLRDHFAALSEELPGSTLEAMQSSGGLIAAPLLTGPHAILSGPAGGLVSVGAIAGAAAAEKAIGFDMGGTSTDVSRWAGELPVVYEAEHAGLRVRAPMMDIHTIAAGGGSLCRVDGNRLAVGPESAGADPGPLVYGHPEARELTLTDVNVALGRLPVESIPLPAASRAGRGAPRRAGRTARDLRLTPRSAERRRRLRRRGQQRNGRGDPSGVHRPRPRRPRPRLGRLRRRGRAARLRHRPAARHPTLAVSPPGGGAERLRHRLGRSSEPRRTRCWASAARGDVPLRARGGLRGAGARGDRRADSNPAFRLAR